MKLNCLLILLFLSTLGFAGEDDSIKIQFKKADFNQKFQIIRDSPDEYKPQLLNELKSEADRNQNSINKNQLNEFTAFINAIILYHKHKYSKAIPAMVSLLSNNKTLSLNDSLKLYSCIIESYVAINNIPKAFEFHKTISDHINSRNIKISPWKISMPKSRLYAEIGLYNEAIKQNRLEWNNTDKPYKDDWYNANYHNNIGVYFNKSKKPDSAIVEFNLALNYLNAALKKDNASLNEYFFVGLIKGNIGQSYMLLNKYAEAIPLLKFDIYWSKKNKDSLNAAISSNEIAKCFIKLNQFDLAKKYIDSAAILLKEKEDFIPILYNKELKAEWHLLTGNLKEAAILYKELTQFKDSLINLEKESQVINQQVDFAVKQKISEIETQAKQLKEDQFLLEKQKHQEQLLLITISFLVFLLLMSLYLYSKLKKNRNILLNKNHEISIQNKIIEDSLKEKEALLKEVHHRVKNNLQIIISLLNLQASKSSNHEVIAELSESKQRILSIALSHENLYRSNNLAFIQMPEYINNLTDQLKYLYNSDNKNITVRNEIEPVSFDMDTALPIGLIINEIVSNSFKHAFNHSGGLIIVSLKKQGSNFNLTISDNGKGFIMDENATEDSKNIGMELIQTLPNQINGNIKKLEMPGTAFEIVFHTSKFQLIERT